MRVMQRDRASSLTRRTFLTGVILTGLSLTVALLSGCGDSDDDDGEPEVLAVDTPVPEPTELPPTPEPTPTATLAPTPEPTADTDDDESQSPEPEPTPVADTPVSDPADLRGTWTRLESTGPSPGPRRDHSLVSDSDGVRVYLFGGHAGGADLSDLWVFDVDSSSWEELQPEGPRPAARFGHNAAYDPGSDQLIIFGGQTGPDFFNDVWVYDTISGEWAEISIGIQAPASRYGSGDAFDTASGTFYVTHGFTFQGRFDDTWAFSMSEETWRDVSPSDGERPLERCLLRGAADPARSRILVFGGQSNVASFHGDLWAFDLATSVWSRLADGPAPRHLYSLVSRGDIAQMLLFGGKTDNDEQNDLWLYSLETDEWFEIPTDGVVPPGRNGHDAAWIPNRSVMLMFGGRDDTEFNDLWSLELHG